MGRRDLDVAEEHLRKARYADAIERFRKLLSDDPENPELRSRCAEAYRLAGNADRAFHHYNKGASIYLRLGDARNALKLLVYANSLSPNEPDILFRMAECKRSLNNLRDFEQLLTQIVSVARAPGDRRRLWALDELCALRPEDTSLALKRAEVLIEVGRIDDATSVLKGVAPRLDPKQTDLIPLLQRGAAASPDRPIIGVELSTLMLGQRRFREALLLIVPFYEKFPEDVGILEMLVRALEGLGVQDKVIAARIELIKARAKRSQRAATLKDVADLLAIAPQDPAALGIAAHAYAVFDESAEAAGMWRTLAHLYERTSRKYDFHRAILMLLRQDPDDAGALELGARALREAGRADEAHVLERRLDILRHNQAEHESTPDLLPPPHPELDYETAPQTAVEPPSVELADAISRRVPSQLSDEHPTTLQDAAMDGTDAEELSDRDVLAEEIRVDLTDGALEDAFSTGDPTGTREKAKTPEPPRTHAPRLSVSKSVGLRLRTTWAEGLGEAPIMEPPTITPAAKTPTRRDGPSAAERPSSEWIEIDSSSDLPAPELDTIRPGAREIGAGVIQDYHPDDRSTDHDNDQAFGELTIIEASERTPTRPFPGHRPRSSARGRRGKRASSAGEYSLPQETPMTPEETTSKVAQLVSDEFLELASQLELPHGNSPTVTTSPAPEEFADPDALRPTLRYRLVADLYEEAQKDKKL